mmetsp:Transcript_6894/g.16019  ORF Transcript_6894/g.16019 Transcript_6894/m.16019 type:complete len:960 (+) Transcript_6894:239-3118(+)
MISTLRTLPLAIASAFLLAVVAEQPFPDVPPFGDFNDFEIELCDKPCLNNGRCIAFDTDNDGVLDPQCFCNTTFQGDLCETPRACSLACENGGTCNMGDAWWLLLELDDGSLEFFKELLYRCSFQEGMDCKFPDMVERCECPVGTNGPLCENTCDVACQNGGECVFWGSGQRCRCADNFYGDQCENECSKGCLNNGICLAISSSDGSGGFEEQCLCRAGFEGDQCETAKTCPMSCENEGVCKFRESWWFEEEGFIYEFWQEASERCNMRDIPISECLGFQEKEEEPYCDCPQSTFGRMCELTCDLDCQNGSTCQLNDRQNQVCPCSTGFAGDLCQFECTKSCVNGVCSADATNQWCECSPFHEGDLCETERACDKSCLNDGKCEFLEGFLDEFLEYSDKYFEECLLQNLWNCPGPDDVQRCTCTSDFVGSDCSQPCPCQNGGTCSTRYWFRNRRLDEAEEIDEDGDYNCECPFGYYGRDCELKYHSENCELNCENGGYCQQGWGDDEIGWDDDQEGWNYDEEEEVEEENSTNSNNQYQTGRQNNNQNNDPYNSNGGINNNNFNATDSDVSDTPPPPFYAEYCVCPDGFTGSSCETQIDACNNQCKNGGICTTDSVSTQGIGNRALQDVGRPVFAPTGAPSSPLSGFCTCPEGYSGEFCERKTCGSGYCSHGGTCIQLPSGQTTSAGDDYVCDCSTSILEETVGIGRNCDSIVYATCPWANSKMNPNEPWTCAGYGRCYKEEGGPTSTPQCYCGSDMFTGPRCEFNKDDPKDVAWSQCSLQCSNDGICLKGAAKPIAEIFIPFVEGTKKSGLFDYQTPDFEYCYCPDGFFGVQCDKQYDICGNKDHICFHGSKCKNDGGEWGCDCAGTESAGLYCQYKSTDDCGDGNLETFCTNEGTCSLDSSSNAVCACSDGWEGTKCETEVKVATPSGGGGDWSSSAVAGTLVSILSIAMLSIVLVIV